MCFQRYCKVNPLYKHKRFLVESKYSTIQNQECNILISAQPRAGGRVGSKSDIRKVDTVDSTKNPTDLVKGVDCIRANRARSQLIVCAINCNTQEKLRTACLLFTAVRIYDATHLQYVLMYENVDSKSKHNTDQGHSVWWNLINLSQVWQMHA